MLLELYRTLADFFPIWDFSRAFLNIIINIAGRINDASMGVLHVNEPRTHKSSIRTYF